MSSKRILIVDDEVGSTRLLKANLELTRQYEVRVENRPENAVATAREFRPHLILLDVVMPHVSGIEVARMLQRDPELSSAAIVFLTAADANHLPARSDPVVDRLPRIAKPAFMENILKLLEENLSIQSGSGPPPGGWFHATPGGPST